MEISILTDIIRDCGSCGNCPQGPFLGLFNLLTQQIGYFDFDFLLLSRIVIARYIVEDLKFDQEGAKGDHKPSAVHSRWFFVFDLIVNDDAYC